jgi:hypothetical protein
MAKYLVIYDLVGSSETSQDYKRLIDKIQTYDDWGNIQRSAWMVKSSKSAPEVRDELFAYMDSNDRLFVLELTGVSAWENVLCKIDWIKQFMESS